MKIFDTFRRTFTLRPLIYMPTIYCDEHGNTGQHLLDAEQPVFALASNDYSHDEATALLDLVRGQDDAEVKFKVLRRTASGQQRLARLLFDPRVNPDRIAAYCMDKRYMVITKIIDIVMETGLHERGVDLYERGGNIAAANMFYCCASVFCGHESFDAMLAAFATLVKRRTDADADSYVAAGKEMLRLCSNPEFSEFLSPFFTREFIPKWLPSQPSEALDPAIPALFVLIDAWGKRKVDRFKIVHDKSKPISANQDFFANLMADAEETSSTVGYDRRTFLFPLRADTLELGDSKLFPQLQIADICAGAIAHLVACNIKGEKDDLQQLLAQAKCINWGVGGLIASPDVTPESLGTASTGGVNPVDPLSDRLGTRLF